MITVEDTGERFIPTQASPYEVIINADRYMFALPHCVDKHVLELGCGSGMGTYLYSLVAKSITAVDYSGVAIDYAKTYPSDPYKVSFKEMNLEKEIPDGKYDVVVATEFLEHIDDPARLIAELDTQYLVWSLPLNSLEISKWHKYKIRGGEEGMQDCRDLIEKRYKIEEIKVQQAPRCAWIFGVAKKRKSWL